MNKLYEVIGIEQKTKKEINAFIIANCEEDALSKASFLMNAKLTGRVEKLSSDWQTSIK